MDVVNVGKQVIILPDELVTEQVVTTDDDEVVVLPRGRYVIPATTTMPTIAAITTIKLTAIALTLAIAFSKFDKEYSRPLYSRN